MNNKYWFLIDLFIGFIFGFIFLYLYKNLKKKSQLNQEEKSCLINSYNTSRIWMYELRKDIYNSHTFTFSMTNICLIEIYKNLLFIFQPLKEPNHKLNDNKLYSKVKFNQVRIYDLNNGIIGLLPMNMIRSKYWSKKFPIVLKNIVYLGNQFIHTSTINLSTLSYKINDNNIRKTLFLFTRTNRSKEDWFYKFVNASQIVSWRKEIRYQLERNDKQKQIFITDNLSSKKDMSIDNNDQEYKKHMMNFFKRTDRFAALDQLSYLKPIDVIKRFLPKFENTKIKYRKQSLNVRHKQIDNRDIRSLNNSKRQYCEQWLSKQNQMDMAISEETTNYNLKKSHSDQNLNANQIETKSSQLSLQTNSNYFQYKTHALLFFVLKYLQKIPHNTIENNIQNPILLLNIFAARCFLDIFDNEKYLECIKNFLHKQFRKIKIPLIEHIIITNLNLGDRLPEIKDIFKPWIDEHGLWSHIKILYDGKLQLTLNVKLKWIRKTRTIEQISQKNISLSNLKPKIDLKEDRKPITQKHIPIKKSWRQRLWPPTHWFRYRRSNKTNINIVENSNKPSLHSEKMTPKISKTSIVIKLEINNFNGILLFNIPPIPSDRIWISFLHMPKMKFSVTPHLGEYRVPFYKIKNKLEKKLRQTFHRYLVMPNMKDFIIPTMNDYLSDIGIILKMRNKQSSKVSEE